MGWRRIIRSMNGATMKLPTRWLPTKANRSPAACTAIARTTGGRIGLGLDLDGHGWIDLGHPIDPERDQPFSIAA